jgi:hypothetical protein
MHVFFIERIVTLKHNRYIQVTTELCINRKVSKHLIFEI